MNYVITNNFSGEQVECAVRALFWICKYISNGHTFSFEKQSVFAYKCI